MHFTFGFATDDKKLICNFQLHLTLQSTFKNTYTDLEFKSKNVFES